MLPLLSNLTEPQPQRPVPQYQLQLGRRLYLHLYKHSKYLRKKLLLNIEHEVSSSVSPYYSLIEYYNAIEVKVRRLSYIIKYIFSTTSNFEAALYWAVLSKILLEQILHDRFLCVAFFKPYARRNCNFARENQSPVSSPSPNHETASSRKSIQKWRIMWGLDKDGFRRCFGSDAPPAEFTSTFPPTMNLSI